ncbi:bacillithiol biosynthesis cysteine-adding enzyme BshC [Bacillus sp. JCM 19041]|uniref:bacillithiol biosynthesis cysteine-adding enzyme BshC n=1 Tax=Bacillus sp. JCM 19041 TaxID=1460637 RepID=UPI0006CF8078
MEKKECLLIKRKEKLQQQKELPKKELIDFIHHVFSTLPETDFTGELKAKVDRCAAQAVTYTDFFQLLMHDLFHEEGLLYLDSGDPALREIEKPFLIEIVEKVELIQSQQREGERHLQDKGYPAPIATEEENAHLFYTIDRKRSRLDYEDGCFYVRETDLVFTKDELLLEVDAHPERFSNNVVTRPLMQEWLLPTAAFVAGPGELAYWATLKGVFAEFGFALTPVIPRLSATFVPRQVEKHLSGRDDNVQSYIDGRGAELRDAWLDEQHTFAIEEVTSKAAQQIEEAHRPLRQLATEIGPTMDSMAAKNKEFIQMQIQFLKERMEKEIRMRHGFELDRYDEAIHWLTPLGYPQERMLNPFVLLNLAGNDIFTRMMSETPP